MTDKKNIVINSVAAAIVSHKPAIVAKLNQMGIAASADEVNTAIARKVGENLGKKDLNDFISNLIAQDAVEYASANGFFNGEGDAVRTATGLGSSTSGSGGADPVSAIANAVGNIVGGIFGRSAAKQQRLTAEEQAKTAKEQTIQQLVQATSIITSENAKAARQKQMMNTFIIVGMFLVMGGLLAAMMFSGKSKPVAVAAPKPAPKPTPQVKATPKVSTPAAGEGSAASSGSGSSAGVGQRATG